MNIQQMRLSETAFGKLTQLALAVELHENQRFSLRKDIGNVVSLLKVACASGNQAVQSRLQELTGVLNSDALGFFNTLGVDLASTPAKSSKMTYRGQVLESKRPAAQPASAETETGEPIKKKKIIYRGKVMYR